MTDQTYRRDAIKERERARKTEEKTARRRRSRYDRPRSSIIWTAVLFGLALGLFGGLYYAWIIQPIDETDIAPWQLETARDTNRLLPDQDAYIMAIMLAHGYENDLGATVARLVELRLPTDDPIQYVADLACRLVRGGYVDSNSRRSAIRGMMRFYQQQGKVGCADQLIVTDSRDTAMPTVIVLPTATLIPPATKTPGPGDIATPIPIVEREPFVPTPTPQRSFTVVEFGSFCSVRTPGMIEVIVQASFSGNPLPGLPVRVRSVNGTIDSTFFTGMKPERGIGYADFQMDRDGVYIIEMPGFSEPYNREIRAQDCFDDDTGTPSIRSYRVVFSGN